MTNNTIIFQNHQNYEIKEKLGEGGFGTIYKVYNKDDNNYYAIKQIKIKEIDNKQLEDIKKEANILASIDNENVVKYYDSFIDNETFNIVMEYCELMDLRDLINVGKTIGNCLEEAVIYFFIKNICLGLKEIHKKKIIHRDLKPENIFITSEIKIKIGDFGIAKQLKNKNEKAKTQIGTFPYMAPEIIRGEDYDNKVDIWAMGCIIYELCTYELYAHNNHEGKINCLIYSKELQNLIDQLLDKDYNERPNIEKVIKIIEEQINKIDDYKIISILEKNGACQNFLIENCINKSLEQIKLNIFLREKKKFMLKDNIILSAVAAPIHLSIFFAALTLAGSTGIGILVSCIFLIPTIFIQNFLIKKRFNNLGFKRENNIIIEQIEHKLIEISINHFKKNCIKQKIIIYNKENFENNIKKIKKQLMSQKYIQNLKKLVRNNFNILLLGNTGAGKSTLINEFLQLKEGKAKESDGIPTETKDFTAYLGNKNNIQYTLFDTNGITNQGKDSINNKIKNTVNEILLRINDKDPNNLIHCIWYCKDDINYQESDKNFIKELLQIYTTYAIPIIFIHTYSLSERQNKTCKKGLEIILNEIFNNDQIKVNEYLNNYIRILAREDGQNQPFGLKELENLTIKKIEKEGLKSAYYEYIRQDLLPILITGAFELIFTNNNMKILYTNASKDLDKYYNKVLSIINNNELHLEDDIKKQNTESLETIYNSFKKIKGIIKDNLKEYLMFNKLKEDNEEFVKKVYEYKSEEYKKKINMNEFCEKIEKYIFKNLSKSSSEVINNMMNIGFNIYLMQIIKEGVKDQFQDIQENVINEIYHELFVNEV